MDNFFHSCPPRMEDARHLTDYRSSTRREEFIKYANGFVRNDDYRLYLQGNAKNIMDSEWQYHVNTAGCSTNNNIHTYPTRIFPPWFVEERERHDIAQRNPTKITYPWKPVSDYRLTDDVSNVLNNVLNNVNGNKNTRKARK